MIRFPFTSMQQLNLDWIMQQLHKILDFMPLNGSAGDVLQRTADGAAWQPVAAISLDIHSMTPLSDNVADNDELAIYDNSAQGNYKATVSQIMAAAPVQSVNGQDGNVILTAADVDALPDSTVVPTATSDLINDSGFITAATAPVTSVNGQTGAVTISVPAQAVSSVNGQTGAVVLDAADVGALADSYVAPVTSVNGMTGDVTLSISGLTPTVLWTFTGNYGDGIAAQTLISSDCSEYPYIGIVYTDYNVNGFNMQLIVPPWSSITSSYSSSTIQTQYIGRLYERSIRFWYDGKIGIYDARYFATYNSNNPTDDNQALMIRQIIGFK